VKWLGVRADGVEQVGDVQRLHLAEATTKLVRNLSRPPGIFRSHGWTCGSSEVSQPLEVSRVTIWARSSEAKAMVRRLSA
jgi:hypothetical protein